MMKTRRIFSLVQAKFYVPEASRGEFIENSPFKLSGGLKSSWLIDGVVHSYITYVFEDDDSNDKLRTMIQYYLDFVVKHQEYEKYFFYSVDDVMVMVHQGEDSNNKWGTQDGIQFTNIDDLSMEEVLALTRENKS